MDGPLTESFGWVGSWCALFDKSSENVCHALLSSSPLSIKSNSEVSTLLLLRDFSFKLRAVDLFSNVRIAGGWGGLNPLPHLADPLPLVKIRQPGGSSFNPPPKFC